MKEPHTVATRVKRDTGTYEVVFSKAIPSQDLALPSGGQNIGAVELCTFLPNSLKNGDVSRRLFMNGLNKTHVMNIMNFHLQLPRGALSANLVMKWMQEAMRRSTGNKTWTHKNDASTMDRTNWDASDLTLTGCRLNIEHNPPRGTKRIVIASHPFHLLGHDVRHMPQGEDRLDLTRCVEYAVKHPEEGYEFPRDFSKLIAKLGGAVETKPGHLDEAVVARWAEPVPIVQEHLTGPAAPRAARASGEEYGQSLGVGLEYSPFPIQNAHLSAAISSSFPQNAVEPSVSSSYQSWSDDLYDSMQRRTSSVNDKNSTDSSTVPILPALHNSAEYGQYPQDHNEYLGDSYFGSVRKFDDATYSEFGHFSHDIPLWINEPRSQWPTATAPAPAGQRLVLSNNITRQDQRSKQDNYREPASTLCLASREINENQTFLHGDTPEVFVNPSKHNLSAGVEAGVYNQTKPRKPNDNMDVDGYNGQAHENPYTDEANGSYTGKLDGHFSAVENTRSSHQVPNISFNTDQPLPHFWPLGDSFAVDGASDGLFTGDGVFVMTPLEESHQSSGVPELHHYDQEAPSSVDASLTLPPLFDGELENNEKLFGW